MQVVHVFNSGSISGPETLVIPALRNASWLREVWSLREERLGPTTPLEDFCKIHGVPVRSFNVSSRLDFGAINQMRRALNELVEGAIIHSHDAKASVYSWLALKKPIGHRHYSVVTHHGAIARPDKLARLYERIFVQGTNYFADSILCVSAADYLNLRARGLAAKKLTVHANGISLPPLLWTQRRSIQRSNSHHWVIVGRLSREKNHVRLFEVLQTLINTGHSEWKVDVVGDGPLKAVLEEMVIRAKMQSNIQFIGQVDSAWRILDNYDCLLNFSHGEGIPISLIEAGWRSTPVFASAVGGIPELCGMHGAELFDLEKTNNEIARQLWNFSNNKMKARQKAEFLRERVQKNYSTLHWLNGLEGIYRRVQGEAS